MGDGRSDEIQTQVVSARSRAFRFLRFVARWMLRSQYRRIEVEGAEQVPETGAVLLVANHQSSLVDSMALLHASPRPASFLAKAPLWKSALLRPALDALGAVPVYRPEDFEENDKRGVRANLETFQACRAKMAAGGSLAIFPEGVSQPHPRLMPVRTGAARIVLDSGAPVTICPVGLVFEHEPARRGRLLIRFGAPFVVDGIAGFDSRRHAITATTRRIEAALKELLAEADTQSELAALRTARIVWNQERGIPAPRSMSEAHERDRAFARGLARLRAEEPATLAAVRAETDAYQRALDLAGIPATLLRGRYSVGRVLRFLLLNLPLLVLGYPVALVAGIVTWPIRRVGDIVAQRSIGGTEDLRPLCRMLGGALLLVVVLIVGGVGLWIWKGPLWAAGFAVVLPLLLAFHVVWTDHSHEVRVRVRTFFLLAGATLRETLTTHRRELYEHLAGATAILEGREASA